MSGSLQMVRKTLLCGRWAAERSINEGERTLRYLRESPARKSTGALNAGRECNEDADKRALSTRRADLTAIMLHEMLSLIYPGITTSSAELNKMYKARPERLRDYQISKIKAHGQSIHQTKRVHILGYCAQSDCIQWHLLRVNDCGSCALHG